MDTKNNSLLFTQQFEKFISLSSSGRRLTAAGKKITPGTVTGYKYVVRLIREYEEGQQIQLRINLLHTAALRILKREKNYWYRFFISFSNFLFNKKGYYDNYVASVFKTIKTFFNYLKNEKGLEIGNFHRSFRV